MSLYSLKELYRGLPPGRYAVGAFNVHNMEYTQAVIKAAEAENSPVILMIGEPIVPFAGLEMLTEICQFAARRTVIPVCIILDHGKDMKIIDKSIQLGLSVMFDGSMLPFEENIKLTGEVVEKGRRAGVSVEGELGCIAGAEDTDTSHTQKMTDPKAAEEFIRRTGVDALAVSIGNCHGLYRGEPQLDLERLAAIKKLIDIPLVLHGGSDLPEDQSIKAIEGGIKKFNIGTDLKYAFAQTTKEILSREPLTFQPPAYLGPAREAVYKVVRNKIRLFGSSGKTGFFNEANVRQHIS